LLLKTFVEKKHYLFAEKAKDWRDSIYMSCKPLEADGTIDERYADEIIACVEEHGAYIVIIPGICIPHSMEGALGVNETAIGFMKLEEPVSFDDSDPEKSATVFFTLAAKNHDAHLSNMQQLFQMLSDDDLVEDLFNVKGPEDLLALDEKYS
jgi:PTS system ascorbate-specific IIA component